MLFGTGDLVAQIIMKTSSNDDDDSSSISSDDKIIEISNNNNNNNTNDYLFLGIDLFRTAKAVTYGSLIFAPVGTKYYPALDKIRIPINLSSSSSSPSKMTQFFTQVLPRVTFDQLIFSPCAIAFYYIVMGVFEGMKSWDEIKQSKIVPNWRPTFETNLWVWPAVQVANFSIIPVQYRLFTVNVVSVGWNAFISYRNTHHSLKN